MRQPLILAILCLAAKYPAQSKESLQPIVILEDISFFHSADGVVKAQLKAPLLWQYETGDMRYPQGIVVHFFDEKQASTATLHAGDVHYTEKNNTYDLTKDVRIHNIEKNQTLTTSHLHWEPTKKEVHTTAPVKVTTEDLQLVGIGLYAKEDLSYYRILNPKGVLDKAADLAPDLPLGLRALPPLPSFILPQEEPFLLPFKPDQQENLD